ncbi:MAG: NADH-quinone oxidoreductase subunit B family protein [Anaerolineaceae bacterium]|jgi:NADH-quinone oxidoreductase B subunit|nr:NADH-quinone oxidoreductase subunit B family protein [Anaerolineaceae bacterium]
MLENLLYRSYRWAQKNSLWVLPFNTGGCNGCDIEILDLLTPRYDVERMGILAEASPRHADVLLCTGPVTLQTREAIWQIYMQMPSPKWVVAVGSCSTTGGVFASSSTVLGGVDKLLPVDLYIPGCPVRPEAIIAGLVKLQEKIAQGGENE